MGQLQLLWGTHCNIKEFKVRIFPWDSGFMAGKHPFIQHFPDHILSLQVESDYCLLLALPCGRDQEDVVSQTESLKAAFISYLQAKQAAGIINVPNPGSNQVRAHRDTTPVPSGVSGSGFCWSCLGLLVKEPPHFHHLSNTWTGSINY